MDKRLVFLRCRGGAEVATDGGTQNELEDLFSIYTHARVAAKEGDSPESAERRLLECADAMAATPSGTATMIRFLTAYCFDMGEDLLYSMSGAKLELAITDIVKQQAEGNFQPTQLQQQWVQFLLLATTVYSDAYLPHIIYIYELAVTSRLDLAVFSARGQNAHAKLMANFFALFCQSQINQIKYAEQITDILLYVQQLLQEQGEQLEQLCEDEFELLNNAVINHNFCISLLNTRFFTKVQHSYYIAPARVKELFLELMLGFLQHCSISQQHQVQQIYMDVVLSTMTAAHHDREILACCCNILTSVCNLEVCQTAILGQIGQLYGIMMTTLDISIQKFFLIMFSEFFEGSCFQEWLVNYFISRNFCATMVDILRSSAKKLRGNYRYTGAVLSILDRLNEDETGYIQFHEYTESLAQIFHELLVDTKIWHQWDQFSLRWLMD